MTGRASGQIQGDDLIAEVLRNMEDGLFRIRRKTIVPAVFRLYLHPADFEPFREITQFITNEIRLALDEKLQSWNSPKRRLAVTVLEKIGLGESAAVPTEHVRAAEQWTVEIFPDLDGKLHPGEIEVYSDLGTPQKSESGADSMSGSLTRRIFPNRPDLLAETQVPPGPETAPTSQIAPIAGQPTLNFPSSAQEDGTKPRAFAYIRYVDEQGQKVFEVTKNLVTIGRGGRSYWVDLKLETVPDVSREHCRIRRDPDTGRFTIEDRSQFGTAVNGKPVGRDAAAEVPKRATISLAGVLDLAWEAA